MYLYITHISIPYKDAYKRDIPSRRFGAKVDLDHDYKRRNTGASQHPSPLGVLAQEIEVLERDRDDKSKHDTKGRPHLPHHSKGATDRLRRRFGGVHWSCTRFRSDSETERETGNQQVIPGVGGGHPEAGHEGDEARDEDGSSAAEQFVQRRIGPASDGSGS